MNETIKNNRVHRLFGRLAAEKKKAGCALCLIVLMVFMWTRVLINKKPQDAAAALQTQQMIQKQSDSQLEIAYIDLPIVKGRNDMLTRDFFAVNNWREFIRSGENQNTDGIERVSVISGDGGEETARRIAERLKIEAISLSNSPQAFINNQLLAVGDKLSVYDADNVYECEVVKIEENKVFMRCGRMKIQLKLTNTSAIDY